MKAYLLYEDKEWVNTRQYSDARNIIQDLGLATLFGASAREIEKEDGKVKQISEADVFLEETMKQVMLVPLETEKQVVYRQEILQNCLKDEALIRELYELSGDVLTRWDKLGRRANAKAGDRKSVRSLITEIHVLQLFTDGLGKLKTLLESHSLEAEGFRRLKERLAEEFPGELEKNLRKILENLSFYANEKEHSENRNDKLVNKPRMVLGCSIGEGLKLENFRLEELATEARKHHDPNGTLGRLQDYWSSVTTDSFSVRADIALSGGADYMEQQVAAYVVSCCSSFRLAFNSFFDQLHIQAGFYRGAVNLRHYMGRFGIHSCFPRITSRDVLQFKELRELVMAVEQRICPTGNTCDIREKNLLIVTGANQGGKSTFLRSIGIAQVMLQCGLMVAAEEYGSGIYPSLFTHFTRREDSEMNSGRLDEELARMSRIVDNLGEASLVLLNESFATTTEKEGSVIAYDIIRALKESGVKILTVTHLLSFARKMYAEAGENGESDVEFLSAERLEDGRRTYRMIQHAPELTSFGLDLYDEIIGNNREKPEKLKK